MLWLVNLSPATIALLDSSFCVNKGTSQKLHLSTTEKTEVVALPSLSNIKLRTWQLCEE